MADIRKFLACSTKGLCSVFGPMDGYTMLTISTGVGILTLSGIVAWRRFGDNAYYMPKTVRHVVMTQQGRHFARTRGWQSATMATMGSCSELVKMVSLPSESHLEGLPNVDNAAISPGADLVTSPQRVRSRCTDVLACTWARACCAFVCLLVLAVLVSIPSPLPLDTSLVFDSSLPIEGGRVACFRIPSIVQASKGALIAFAEGRLGSCGDCVPTGIAVTRSLDGGLSWALPTWLVRPYQDVGGNPTAAWDAVHSRILLQYVRGRAMKGPPHQPCNPAKSNWQLSSDDDGRTWSPPYNLTRFLGPWAGSLVGPGVGIQLSARPHKGRLLFTGHWGVYNATQVWYSDDGGRTYELSTTVFRGFDESQLVELGSGRLLINMRNTFSRVNCKCRAVSISDDGGETFGAVTFDAALISPVCQASLARIYNEVYFSNPQHATFRVHGNVQVSSDDTASWQPLLSITNAGPRGSFDYSAIVQAALFDDPSAGGIIWSHNPVPVLSAFGGLPFGAWTIYFTRFPLRRKHRVPGGGALHMDHQSRSGSTQMT